MSKDRELLKDDYLWDGLGEADAEVVRLERALGKFRHIGRAPELPASFAAATKSQENLGSARAWFQFAAVAASALVVFSLWMGLRVHSGSMATGSEWGVEQVAGGPRGRGEASLGAGAKSTARS